MKQPYNTSARCCPSEMEIPVVAFILGHCRGRCRHGEIGLCLTFHFSFGAVGGPGARCGSLTLAQLGHYFTDSPAAWQR